jgi:hypothetical protein
VRAWRQPVWGMEGVGSATLAACTEAHAADLA